MRVYVARGVEFDGDRSSVRAQDFHVRNWLLVGLGVLTAISRWATVDNSGLAMWVLLIALSGVVVVWIGGAPTRVVEFDAKRRRLSVGHRGMLAENEEFDVERSAVQRCFVRQLDEWNWGWFLVDDRREMMLCTIVDEYDAKKLASALEAVYGPAPTMTRSA